MFAVKLNLILGKNFKKYRYNNLQICYNNRDPLLRSLMNVMYK